MDKSKIRPATIAVLAALVGLSVSIIAFVNFRMEASIRANSPKEIQLNVPSVQPTMMLVNLALPTETQIPYPTVTSIPKDNDYAILYPSPTPIQLDKLPTPFEHRAQAYGRVLCNGKPVSNQTVFVTMLQSDDPRYSDAAFKNTSYQLVSDENGRWFYNEFISGEYTVLDRSILVVKNKTFTTLWLKVGQSVDFGDMTVKC